MTKDFFHILITQEKSSSILNKFSSSAEDIYNNHDIIFSSYKVVNGNTLINDPEGLKLCFARNGSYLNATWLRTNMVNSNAYCK